MDTIILDGRSLSKKITENLKEKIEVATKKYGRPPCLATILVGEDPASKLYVNIKNKTCERIGITAIKKNLPFDIKIEDLLLEIKKLNKDPKVDGILVQMPLPDKLRKYESEVMTLISPDKDVDGFHPNSMGLNMLGNEKYGAATPKGMIRLQEEYNINIDGEEVVIVNRTPVIGKL